MSACWADFRNSGRQDVYVSNMWSAAGQRVSAQSIFHANDSPEILAQYRNHARGNSLYRNAGKGSFQNVADDTGCEAGRWAWSADAWDFDHDGFADLYVANGYISGANSLDAGSFFWRHVVGNSPSDARPSPTYERGWNAVNEWVRTDGTWNGYERNVLYRNNGDGTFSDISGVSGLDFLDDSRAFALADLDHDGRLEVVLKNRNAPQVRVLRNGMSSLGDAIVIRLRGTKSNRDAIGTAVTIECGTLRQTKYLQAGSGFLSQHTKELFFGLGRTAGAVHATVRWTSGLTQAFRNLPVNQRVAVTEAESNFVAKPFGALSRIYLQSAGEARVPPPDSLVETWLLDSLPAIDFSLEDTGGRTQTLAALHGKPVLLHFFGINSPESAEQLEALGHDRTAWAVKGLQLLCVHVDETQTADAVRVFLAKHELKLAVVLASPEIAGVYNILYRYLFDRRRDLPLPCSFLIDANGMIVKLYQGRVDPRRVLSDAETIPKTAAQRMELGLPFSGTLYAGTFQRNDFTYGIALFQRGYLDQAAASFKQVIASKPDEPEAYYNLGTLYLRKNDLLEAQRYLKKAVELQPDSPEAWNNLGMIAAQQDQPADAIANFQKSVKLRPNYTTALLNLGNLYRRQGDLAAAAELLNKALQLEPQNPEANYSVAMLAARQNDLPRAADLLRSAVQARPVYAEAWNNLGVILIRLSRNFEAEAAFEQCIVNVPAFDQAYLNLAQLYALSNDKQRARDTLQSLLRLQPQHKLARQALEMLN